MRRLALFAGTFSAAVFLAQYLLPEAWLVPWALACFPLALAGLLLPVQVKRRAVVIGAALSLGLGYTWLYAHQIQRPAAALADTAQAVTATLCGYAEPSPFGARATVRIEGVPGKAVLYGGDFLLDLEPGQTVTGPVQLRSAGKIRDEDITTFTSKGVFLLAYSCGTPTIGPGSAGSLRWLPQRLSRTVQAQIKALFGPDSGFFTAILTGNRLGLPEDIEIPLSEAGLSHIMAVSGMHCAILMGLASAVAGRRSRLTAGVTIPLLWFYALFTGASPSTVRACIMLTLAASAPLFRRESDGPTTLAAALMLILLGNPYAAASVSLQLSFAAMAGLLLLTPALNRMLLGCKKSPGPVLRFVSGAVSASLGAMAFTAPLSGYYFGSLCLIAPLSGVLCLWAVSLVFGLGFPAVLSSLFLPVFGKLIAVPAVLFVRYILYISGILAQIPGHAVYFSNPYLKYWLACAYLLFALAWLTRRAGRRGYALAALLAALTLCVTAKLGAARYQADLDAVILDVGQGQCIVLASAGEYAVVDCGSANRWRDAGSIAAQQLRSMGCRRIDWLILTHYDSDHTSGVPGLLTRLGADTLLAPEGGGDTSVLASAAERGTAITPVTAPVTLPLGRAKVTVYPPIGDGEDNERGLTILASAGENDLLITGDMDAGTERRLLETCVLPDIETLIAGHHGSKYSTSNELLAAVKPETAVISTGSNAYGHPSPEAMARLARAGCAIYRTDLQGSIHIAYTGQDQEDPR